MNRTRFFYVILLAAEIGVAAIPASERNALIAIHDSTGGLAWSNRANWVGAAGTECTWAGIRCNDGETAVIEIFLNRNNLTGSLPPEIGSFPGLQELSLYSNALTGPIPTQIGNLTQLRRLELYENRFTGSIPRELGNLANVTFFALGNNQLSGSIPPELGNLINAEFFSLNGSGVTGTIPAELGRLASARTLSLSYNVLSGPIPRELGNLSNLVELQLNNNRLSGTIPEELSRLTKLTELSLQLNQLTGPIPASLSQLTSLQSLGLGVNQLSGSIPRELGQLTILEIFSINQNQLSGPIPPELGQLRNLIFFDAFTNQFSGPIPPQLGQMQRLEYLSLADNELTGTIPPELAQMSNLQTLGLAGNQLSGPIPREFGQLLKLVSLSLDSQRISGPIPAELGNLTELQELVVFENQLSGPIPRELGQLTKMRLLLLGGNQLTGTIPDQLMNMTELTFLDLRGNLLTGPIPTEISRLTKLDTLSVPGNRLSGPIPSGISQLTNLKIVRLDYNELAGTLPSFRQLTRLEDLVLNSNHFEGTIPPELGTLTTLRSLWLGGNRFTGTIPRELGQLSNLFVLNLANNDLRGSVPGELMQLTNLIDNLSDFRYNAIITTNSTLRDFLNRKQDGGNWENTQTVPPVGIRTSDVTDRSVVVSWTLIDYRFDEGGYRVTLTPSSGSTAAITATPSKESSSILVRGLRPATSYSLVVQSVTHPHGLQQNTIVSDPAPAVTATTTAAVILPTLIELTTPPVGLVQQGGVPQNEDSYVLTNSGDMATTVTLAKQGTFFDQSPSTFTLNGAQSQTVRLTSISQPVGAYDGFSLPSGTGVPADLVIPIRLLSIAAPAGTAVAEVSASRIDTAGDRNGTSQASVTFSNSGTGTLTGMLLSDVSWILAPTGLISIPPGAPHTVQFTIDRSKRPDSADVDGGTLSGSLRLIYLDGTAAASLADYHPLGDRPPGVSVAQVTVADTTKPSLSTSPIPPLSPGEIARFIPGVAQALRTGGSFISDLSITNSFGATSLNDLRLFFTTPAGATASVASFNSVAPSQSLSLGSVVKSVFGVDAEVGTLQLRTGNWEALQVSASLLNLQTRLGTLGGSIPIFRSDRSAGNGESLYLTGVRGDAGLQTTIYVQEASGNPANMRLEVLDSNGAVIASRASETLAPFGVLELSGVVPANAATVILTSLSGRITGHARVVDSSSGDHWSIVDWSRFGGFGADQPIRVPMVRVGSGPPGSRRRPVRRGSSGQSLQADQTAETWKSDLVLFNSSSAAASIDLTLFDSAGSSSETVTLTPRQTVSYADVARSLFRRSGNSIGYVVITPVRGTVAATSRTYRSSGETNIGTSIPVVAASSGLRLGQSQSFAGVEDSTRAAVVARTPGSYRTDFGIVETAGGRVKVRAALLYFDGRSLATLSSTRTRDYELGPRQFLLVENVAASIIGPERETTLGNLRNLQLQFQVVEGDGAATVFTIVTDNGSDDPSLRME